MGRTWLGGHKRVRWLCFFVWLLDLALASHWPPALQGVEVKDDGLAVYWSLDLDTYPDADPPDATYVTLNGVIREVTGQTSTQATIPKKTIDHFDGCGCPLTLGVMYVWNGSPGDQKVASFETVNVQAGQKPHFPPRKVYAEAPFTFGPWVPLKKYIISVKGGYSYGAGYGYSKWTMIVERAPDGAPAVEGWHPWNRIAPEATVKLVPGGKLTPVWRDKDHLDIFAVDTNGHVATTWWDKSTGWFRNWIPAGDPFPDGSYPLMKPGAQVTALWRVGWPHLDIFATGQDGSVWASTRTI
ncbi:hypothetical protein NLG97_g10291 [Lecanicillium saksenae]|uniref:Uncharacterized protein n=1 Tax=Lecanicillium saksenae TaxID=468837 RepID=A0ACC1QE39_9HYPO|nr:hypothetical protein NLG97_g10291 [Lecanicillium saksenae]